MNKIILILTFILTANLYSQEYESDSISILRERWMVGHRMFPANEIPSHGLPDAIRYRDSLRVHQGFFVNHRIHNSPYEYDPLGWSSLGPTPGHFDSYGTISGRCSFVKYDPSNPNIIYAGGAGGGLWKSIDNGTTFMPLTDNLPSLSSGAIAIDEANNIIYYGTGESTYFTYVYYGYGMYRSTDGGNSFSQIGGGLPFPCYISAIAIKPNQRNVILAAVGCNYTNWNYQAGIYKSTDYGATFQRIVPDPGLQGLVCTDIAFSPDGSTAYAVGPQNNSPNVWENGVGYRLSTDGGTTFTLRNDIVYVQNRTKLSICTSTPNRIYIITNWYDANNLNYIDIYKSQDAGLSYSLVWHHYVMESGWDYIQPYYNLCIKVHPNYPDLVYFGITALYISNDGCSTFNKIGGYGMSVHPDMHCIDVIPGEGNQNKVIVSCDGGIYSSLNYGNSWNNLNSTLTLTQFYRMSANKDNLDNILACSQDNGMQQKYSNFSHVWTDIIGGDMGNVKFNPINSNYCIAMDCWGAGLHFSNNAGSTFSQTATINNTAWVMPIIWHPTQENIVYASGKLGDNPIGIIKSNNYGYSWNTIASNFPTTSAAEQMAISNSNPNVMYASRGSISFWPYSYSEQKLYKTTNLGADPVSWSDLGIMDGSNPPIPKRYISAIAINPINENEVYIGLSGFGCGHIWKTSDGGSTWNNISTNLPKVPVNSIVIENLSMMIGSNVIVGTDCGVFILPFGSNNWLEVGGGLPNSIVMDLDIKPYSSILRAATHGRGVWEIDLRGEGGSNKLNVTGLKRYNLNQNYPNPFNPSTKISYEVPVDVNVTIKIFDVIGREVTTLVNNEFKKSGFHTIEWNASKYASGIYFYRLEAGEYKNVRKMMLVK